MTIIGINLMKINVERKANFNGKINISNNVSLTDVDEIKLGFAGEKQKSLKFSFKFESKFEPEIGFINISGDLVYLTDEKKADDLLKKWKKDKKLDPILMTDLLNNILNKCNIEALLLSKEIGLPAPIPLPKINPPKTEEKKKK